VYCDVLLGFEGSVKTSIDRTQGNIDVEILCSRCEGHLGHVFRRNYTDYDPELKKQRHCVNSCSIVYVDKKIPKELKLEILDLSFMLSIYLCAGLCFYAVFSDLYDSIRTWAPA